MSITAKQRIDSILNELEDTREIRYGKGKASRKDGILHQGKGFRSEWSKYLEDCNDNLYNS